MLELTPEPFSAIIIAVGTAAASIVALGIKAVYSAVSSGNVATPEDKMKSVLEANTVAMTSMIDQFRHNNGLFVGLGHKVEQLGNKMDQTNSTLKDIERIQASILTEHIRSNSRGGQ